MTFAFRKILYAFPAVIGFLGIPENSGRINLDDYVTFAPAAGRVWSAEFSSPVASTSAAVPSVLILTNGNIRLFHCDGAAGMKSATSTDGGKTFSSDSGTRVTGGCDGTFIHLADGRYRLLLEERIGTTFGKSQVVSYISPDGLAFTKESGVRWTGSSNDAGFTGVISVLKLTDGRHRLYYVGDPLNPASTANGIRTAISSDEGMTWSAERTTNLLPRNSVDPHPVRLITGGYRLYYREGGGTTQDGGLAYADSTDGVNFTRMGIALQGPRLADPALVRLPDGSMKMFYWDDSGALIGLRSATSPAPPSLSITTSKSKYTNGDTLTATEFRLLNPAPSPTQVKLRVWLKVPTVGEVPLIDIGADGSFYLPGGVDASLAPLSLITITSTFPPKGGWELNSRISDPATGLLYSEDLNSFTVE